MVVLRVNKIGLKKYKGKRIDSWGINTSVYTITDACIYHCIETTSVNGYFREESSAKSLIMV